MRYTSLFCSLVTLAFAQSQLIAADKNWSGGNGNWNVDANWTPAGVPAATDTAIIKSGTVTATTAVTIAGLNLSGGTLTSSAQFTATTVIWSDGTLGGSGQMLVPAGGTLTLGRRTTFRS